MCVALMLSAGGAFALPKCKGSYYSVIWTNCFGRHSFQPGYEYVGDFRSGLMHGQGKFTHPSGTVWEGVWENNQLILSNNLPHQTLLASSFKNLSKGQRKQIQSILSELGFYKSSVDGLYGKGTKNALAHYNKQYFADVDLDNKDNANQLLEHILNSGNSQTIEVVGAEPEGQAVVVEKLQSDIATATTEVEPLGTTCADNPVLCTPVELCTRSTMIKDDLTIWSDTPEAIQFVAAANKININCGVYVEPSCDTDAALCSVAELCEKSVKVVDDQNAWSDTSAAEPYVKLSKQFGLACLKTVEVVQPPKATPMDFEGEFKGSDLLRRKQLQYALKKLGFYSSSIDGLWGKGTSSAIVKYAQANGVSGRCRLMQC